MGYGASELDDLNFEAVKKEYLSKLPLVAKDEILIEKSPIYTEDDGNGQIEGNFFFSFLFSNASEFSERQSNEKNQSKYKNHRDRLRPDQKGLLYVSNGRQKN